jgi:HAD superfamily hydrolase (TIGR01484 family)
MNSVYVSDLDGTLLDTDANLSAYTFKSLEWLLGEGLLFTVATARSIGAVKALLGTLPLPLPVIELNGAGLSDLATGRHFVLHTLPAETAHGVLEFLENRGFSPFIASFDGRLDRLSWSSLINDGAAWYLGEKQRLGDARLRPVECNSEVLKESVVGFTTFGRKTELVDLTSELNERFFGLLQAQAIPNHYIPGWWELNINHIEARKDKAVVRLLHDYCPPNSKLTVFGDNLNDLEMFGVADRSIAVSNAIADALHVADLTIGSNHEDGVVKFLELETRNAFSAGCHGHSLGWPCSDTAKGT